MNTSILVSPINNIARPIRVPELSAESTGSGCDDTKRFTDLVQPHLRLLLWHALRLTGNMDDAEDLRQDTLLKAYRAFRWYRDLNCLRPWLLKIMTNTHISQARRRRPTVTLESPDTLETLALHHDGGEGCEDPQALVLRQELTSHVHQAMSALGPHHRQVLQLCDLEGLSYDEAAHRLGCPVGTIRSRLHRGRERLRDQLGALRSG